MFDHFDLINMERVVASAIKFFPVANPFPMIVTGKRHADVFHTMYLYDIQYDKSSAVQGFLTDTGRFVNRYEAMKIALAADQIIVPKNLLHDALFSEDVW